MLASLIQDLRFTLRALRKNPVFAATAVLTLALAIGGNTAIFTVIRTVLLSPLPYHDPGRLVRFSGGATPTRFLEMRARAQSFAEIGAYTGVENLALSGGGEPELLRGVRVSAGFLHILGIDTLRGRGFRPEEDSPGGPSVALISTELWQRRFAGDPQIIGRTITLAAQPYTIIGVLPPHFQFPVPDINVWMTAPSEWSLIAPKSRALSPFLSLFGRLQPSVSFEQANAEMKVIRRQYGAAHPAMLDAKSKTPVEVTPLKDDLVANVRSMLWILFGAVGFVLLIACANVANLLLIRATSREREFAVRSALGAARLRLIRQLMIESTLLSLSGGALGVVLASFTLQSIPKITAIDLPRASEIHMDWVVFGFAAGLSITTGMLFGLAPSLGASRPDLMHVLRASGEAATRGGKRKLFAGLSTRTLLPVAQVALCVVLLIGAALLIESVAFLRGVEVGFNPSHLLTIPVSLPESRYSTDQKKASFFQALSERMQSVPGVQSVAAAISLPMMGYAGSPVQDAAKPLLPLNERLIAKINLITPRYFRTLQIPLKRGRDFTDHDTPESQRVAIIDESLAHRFWPGYPSSQDPVGQRLIIGGVNPKPAEIVGVVGDVHQNLDSQAAWRESVYIPFAQNPASSAIIALRTSGEPLSFTGAVREQVRELDRDQAVGAAQTMDDRVEAQVGQRHLLVILLGSFAAMALLLALIGIYGVIAYSVAQRVQEVGIRRALGAQQSDILFLVIGEGFVLALAGIALGLGGALALTRVLGALLFHVSPTDPATFLSIAVLFLLIALAASYIPARRAAQIDPIAALRV